MTSSVRTPWKSQRFRIGSLSEENISLINEAAKSTVLDRELEDEEGYDSGPRIRCPLCGWSPRRKTIGSAVVDIRGTHSIGEASAQLACISGQ